MFVQLLWFCKRGSRIFSAEVTKNASYCAHWIERISGVLLIGVSMNLAVKYCLVVLPRPVKGELLHKPFHQCLCGRLLSYLKNLYPDRTLIIGHLILGVL